MPSQHPNNSSHIPGLYVYNASQGVGIRIRQCYRITQIIAAGEYGTSICSVSLVEFNCGDENDSDLDAEDVSPGDAIIIVGSEDTEEEVFGRELVIVRFGTLDDIVDGEERVLGEAQMWNLYRDDVATSSDEDE